jgi:undecaprenyl-diphosphatase
MLYRLEQFDTNLFLKINSCHSPFFDKIMWLVSGQIIWIPFFLLIIFLFIKQERKKSILAIIFLIIAIIIADSLSVHLFKNVFHRLRPCHNASIKNFVHIVKNHCGGKYGFVSSHSSNFMTIAVFSSYLIRKRWYIILSFSITLLVMYSRIYLGVHYPGDVVGGAILGFFIGFIFFKFYFITLTKLKK